MPKFLTIFPYTVNVHLIKDVGMVPFILHKKYGYDSTIASYKLGDYPYLKNEVEGLKQVFIKKKINNTRLNVLFFILKNFKKYDILQVYHYSVDSLLFISFFSLLKIFNKKTKTYLKLDADDGILGINFKGFKGYILKYVISKISLISVETKIHFNKLKESGVFGNSLIYLPNGFYDNEKKMITSYNVKINKIITVGRIGTYQKFNETLLDAFELFSKQDSCWCLDLIGPIEENFKTYIDEFFIKNPNLVDRVKFVGSISDRDKISDLYKEAKIFVLTSRYEGFPLVFLEAMKTGCTIVSSDFTASKDVFMNNNLGRLFPVGDAICLSKHMVDLSMNEVFLAKNCNEVQEFAYNEFYWPKLIDKIHDNL